MTPIFETVEFVLLSDGAQAPTRAHEFDAGNDLYASADGTIKAGCLGKVPTGLALSVPKGAVGLVKDRSSMGLKGLHVFSGVIDFGYDGPISVILFNSSSVDYEYTKGVRIAQLLFVPLVVADLVEVGHLASSERGKKGWGSSGA